MTARVLLAFALALLFTRTTYAHGFEPSRIELREARPHFFTARWTIVPGDAPEDRDTQLEMPAQCHVVGTVPDAPERPTTYDCAPGGLEGARVGVTFSPTTQHEVLLDFAPLDGAAATFVLRPASPAVTIPTRSATARWRSTAQTFLSLGVAHLLTGWDHLLFLLCLVLWVRPLRARVATLTAFTLGHSLTLALAALGHLVLDPAFVEAWIAATILLLAVTLSTHNTSHTPRTAALTAGCCGLVHGLGFAGALAHTGLPPTQTPLALASFNLGVEFAQVALVLALVPIERLGAMLPTRAQSRARTVMLYAAGALSAMLLLERVAAFRD